MKNYTLTIAFLLIGLSVGVIHSCKKESMSPGPNPYLKSPIAQSFTEEFKNVYTLVTTDGWITKTITDDTLSNYYEGWIQGQIGGDKSGNPSGLLAYSYSSSKDEYAYSSPEYGRAASSWLITPLLFVKNGDKISFFTSATPGFFSAARLQVLMSKTESADVGDSAQSVGGFADVLIDINPREESGSFPMTWTKYEYTFSNLAEKTKIRIAFRRYQTDSVAAPSAIGIDQFKFSVN